MLKQHKELYEFGPFLLDVAERSISRSDGVEVSQLPEKSFQTLCLLVRNSGHLLGKSEILDQVWPDSFVEENNLDKCIHAIRRALGDRKGEQKYIETVRKYGYRFVAEVKRPEAQNTFPAGFLESGTSPEQEALMAEADPVISTAMTPSGAWVMSAKWYPDADKTKNAENAGERDVESPAISQPAVTETKSASWPVRRLAVVAAVLIGVSVLAAAYSGFFRTDSSASAGTRSIAVLPLRSVSTAGRDEVYEIGIADSLIYRLSSMKGLAVRSLNSVRKFAETDHDALSAGKELRVDYVLTSNYQIVDGRMKITSQLINVDSGRTEETYKTEKDAGNVFALQDAVASEIGNLLLKRFGTSFDSVAVRRGTENEDAYRLYLQAMYLIEKNNRAAAERAIELLDRALALDPNYARAWAGKARAHCLYSHVGTSTPDIEYAIAKPSIERALALDSNLPEAYAVLGVIRADYDWNFADAERYFNRALEIAPNTDVAHRWYARRLAGQGRTAEAIERTNAVLDLSPNSIFDQFLYGQVLYFARRYDEAAEQMERVAEMDPTPQFAYALLWRIYHKKADHPRAYEYFTKALRGFGRSEVEVQAIERSYSKDGWHGVLRTQMEFLQPRISNGSESYDVAVLFALLGEKDQAFRHLNDAVKGRSANIGNLGGDPGLDSLRDDPRFGDLIKRVELAKLNK